MDSEKNKNIQEHKQQVRTAILVDGGFYRKRAATLCGKKNPKDRAEELFGFCMDLLADKHQDRCLYRIFYYDCPPITDDRNIYNPITKKSVRLGKSDESKWTTAFLEELKHHRKIALRLGRLSENQLHYNLKYDSFKKLINKQISIDDLTENDIKLNVEQKGVDMRIGIDISSLSIKKQVDQIILISGDSDFVPAAKQARREGIDFILAPMKADIKSDLFEHIDGKTDKLPRKTYTKQLNAEIPEKQDKTTR